VFWQWLFCATEAMLQLCHKSFFCLDEEVRKVKKMHSPRELQGLYKQGVNITQLLREEHGLQQNSANIIEIAYDLQAGSYVEYMKSAENEMRVKAYSAEIARTVMTLCSPASILEAGVGEATTLSGVMRNMGPLVRGYGFDLSWSRIAWIKQLLFCKCRDEQAGHLAFMFR
jgi:hypothetical protein